MKLNKDTTTIIAAAATVAVLYWLAKREVAGAAAAVGEAVNPISDQNIFYRGISRVEDTLQGDGEQLPYGVRIYEWWHGPNG